MNKVYSVFSVLATIAIASSFGNDSVYAAEKGFAPQYVGAGAGVAFTEGLSETEAALFGAYRTPGINTPISIRGALFPANGVEGQASLTWDFPVAKNANLYVGPGVFGNRDQVYPTIGVGVEYLFDKANTVVFAGYDRVFIEDSGANLAKVGIGYQF